MVAAQQRIASAYHVLFGQYGQVTSHAKQRGVSRQYLYKETHATCQKIQNPNKQPIGELKDQLRTLTAENRLLRRRLQRALVLETDKQTEFAATALAIGCSLSQATELLAVLLGDDCPSRATLGRWTNSVAKKCQQALEVLDERVLPKIQTVCADEIYVRAPVLMMVCPESHYWASGQLTDSAKAENWQAQFERFGALNHVVCDAGTGLQKGIELASEQRQNEGQKSISFGLDHFHTLREGERGLRRLQGQANRALETAEKAKAKL